MSVASFGWRTRAAAFPMLARNIRINWSKTFYAFTNRRWGEKLELCLGARKTKQVSRPSHFSPQGEYSISSTKSTAHNWNNPV